MIKLIAAISLDGAIGNNDKLLWDLPEDLLHFKKLTEGNICIIGKNTYDTLPSQALKNRTYIIVKSNDDKLIDAPNGVDIHVKFSVDEALKKARQLAEGTKKEICVVGGESIYNQMLDLCDIAEITWINKTYPDANKRFQIDKLFHNFYETDDRNWVRSKTGILYKIINYKSSKK